MIELGRELLRTIDSAEAGLRQVSEIDSTTPVLAGGWSRKQVIGLHSHTPFILLTIMPPGVAEMAKGQHRKLGR